MLNPVETWSVQSEGLNNPRFFGIFRYLEYVDRAIGDARHPRQYGVDVEIRTEFLKGTLRTKSQFEHELWTLPTQPQGYISYLQKPLQFAGWLGTLLRAVGLTSGFSVPGRFSATHKTV